MLVGHVGERESGGSEAQGGHDAGVVLPSLWLMTTSGTSMLQDFQDHMSEAQHQQRLGEMQHSSQTCLLSLLPMPRDILERDAE